MKISLNLHMQRYSAICKKHKEKHKDLKSVYIMGNIAEIQILIEEWQTKWKHLQEMIDDKIKAKDYAGAYRDQCKATTLRYCIKDLYKLVEKEKKADYCTECNEYTGGKKCYCSPKYDI